MCPSGLGSFVRLNILSRLQTGWWHRSVPYMVAPVGVASPLIHALGLCFCFTFVALFLDDVTQHLSLFTVKNMNL